VPFPIGGGADPPAAGSARHVLGGAVAAQLVTFPAAAIASEYVGTGAAGYITAGLAGLACAAAARAAGARRAWLAVVALAYAALAVALAYRLVPGGVDPVPTSGQAAATYLAAAAGALVWAAGDRRRT
jgi:hypothetical protein